MRHAVFGDIHANLEALEAVIADARAEDCKHFACTGDIVGYNANPNECTDLIRTIDYCPVVRGNHDEDASGAHPLMGINERARRSLLWTREALSSENRRWLKDLPLVLHPDDCIYTLVHATLCRPQVWGYVLKPTDAAESFAHQERQLCFHGHTHLSAIYEQGEGKLSRREGTVDLRPDHRYLCNVGSVGAPREKDRRAAYAIYDDTANSISIRRVEYDRDTARQKCLDAGLLD